MIFYVTFYLSYVMFFPLNHLIYLAQIGLNQKKRSIKHQTKNLNLQNHHFSRYPPVAGLYAYNISPSF
jgi:hypothetical protein